MILKGRTLSLIVAGMVLLSVVAGETQEKKGRSGKKEDRSPGMNTPFGLTSSRKPIDIVSDTVEANQKQNTVVFKGNVIAKQEEITLFANLLTIYYSTESKAIKTVIAEGNVKIIQAERRATGQKATFHHDENKMVLEGDAVIREGENVVRGERVIYYVDEERSVVEGGKGSRVSTTITPPKKEP